MSNEVLISFIMPAKNASEFITEAIEGVRNQTIDNWELIIIEDNSDDDTYNIAQDFVKKDNRIQLYRNRGAGKVIGLNYGYTFAQGDLIKCIDADDILHRKFIEYCIEMNFDAMCHSYYAVSSDLELMGIGNMNDTFIKSEFEYCLNNLLGMARWTWTVSRKISENIFPMPVDLPYEDTWFSLVIKRFANNIVNVKTPLYYYRQHDDQTFGGIYNYSGDIISFRANRKIKLMEVIDDNLHRFSSIENVEYDIREYFEMSIKDKITYRDIVSSKLVFKNKIKIAFIKKYPIILSILKRIKHYRIGMFMSQNKNQEFMNGFKN